MKKRGGGKYFSKTKMMYQKNLKKLFANSNCSLHHRWMLSSKNFFRDSHFQFYSLSFECYLWISISSQVFLCLSHFRYIRFEAFKENKKMGNDNDIIISFVYSNIWIVWVHELSKISKKSLHFVKMIFLT